MEDVIILILFTYPGALAEYVYHHLAADKSFLRTPDQIFRVARDFLLSAGITLCTLSLFNWIFQMKLAFPSIMSVVPKGSFLWVYLLLSLGVSAAVGAAWYGLALLWFHCKNKKQEQNTGLRSSIRKTAWKDFLNTEGVPYENCVLAIYRNGQLIRAGISKHLTDEIAEDPGVTLMYCDQVEEELRKPKGERALLGAAVYHYIDLHTGTEVALYDGNAMVEAIRQRRV